MVRTLHSREETTKAHVLALSLMAVLSPDLGESGDDECGEGRETGMPHASAARD